MHPQNQTPGDDDAPEVDIIARAEAARKRSAALKLALGFLLGGGAIAGLVALGMSGELAPKVDEAEQQQAVLLESNDPQCRALIDDITAFGERWKAEDAQMLEDAILSDEPERVKSARQRLSERREQLEQLRIASKDVNLRFETSPTELREWFKGVDVELRLLDLQAEMQQKRLEAKARGETFVPLEKKKKRGKIVGEKPKKKRTPGEKVDAAVVQLYDLFANFRVWHTASEHPCGAADPGETPWTPEDASAKPDEPTAPAQ